MLHDIESLSQSLLQVVVSAKDCQGTSQRKLMQPHAIVIISLYNVGGLPYRSCSGQQAFVLILIVDESVLLVLLEVFRILL